MGIKQFCKACEQLAEMLRTVFGNLDSSEESEKSYFQACTDKGVNTHYFKKYDYIPVARKNLAYQRRNY